MYVHISWLPVKPADQDPHRFKILNATMEYFDYLASSVGSHVSGNSYGFFKKHSKFSLPFARDLLLLSCWYFLYSLSNCFRIVSDVDFV